MVTRIVNKYKEPYDVYIGRGSVWGNPFKIGVAGNRQQVIALFREYAIMNKLDERAKIELKDKVLGCFCKPLECHGDVLAGWANEC